MATFKTRARVIQQLGRQLIRNESIALLELIKNSYDADASFCKVEMTSVDSKNEGEITITDDGEGMDESILSNVWLEIGTSYKQDLANKEDTKRTPKYNRLRLGEKGIGRFGVHRLGNFIRIVTRKSDKEEYVMTINWGEICHKDEKDKDKDIKYLEDIPVNIEPRPPERFKNTTGTEIIIQKLHDSWTRKMVRDCYRSVVSLNSPFDSSDSFRTEMILDDDEWIKDLPTFEEIDEYKLFSFDILMEGNEIQTFKYEFIPWGTMSKLKYRCITHTDKEMKISTRMVHGNQKEIKLDVGPVRFKGIIFDRDTRTLDLGVQNKKMLKDYLNINGGIRIFRDNMRVLNYGEPGNDWLNLDGRRVNIPAKRISNNIIIGAVYLDREKSNNLIEKTNREGFIENEAYWELCDAVRYAIDKVETFRKIDKDLLRKYYGLKKVSEPVITSIAALKEVVEKNIHTTTSKKEIYRYLDRIESDYEQITENLIKSAGAGLNLIVIIHQIEKIIKTLKVMLKKKTSLEVLLSQVEDLSALVEGYSILVKKSEKRMRNLKAIVNQAIFNMKFRLDDHQIMVDNAFKKRMENLDGWCSEAHALSALMNIFDNSIWWLKYSKTKKPEIFIDISDALKGYVCILVADNGPGFSLPTDEIIKPFVSNKPEGMGIGLHLTHQIMTSLGGKLLFPEQEDFDLPERFNSGAKIALAFKTRGK